MSQPGIATFTRRVTRIQTRQKSTLLDTDNSNLVTLGGKNVPSSPLKSKRPEIQESSPAKIKKPSKPVEQKRETRGRKKKEPTPPANNGETIQQAFKRQLEGLKSPTKRDMTPEKFKITPPEDKSPEAEPAKIPTIRRALRFDQGSDVVPESLKTSAIIEPMIKPVMAGKIKRERAQNSQPNSPSTASPHMKKLNFDSKEPDMTTKDVLLSPKKAPQSPLASPKKLETRTRAQIMLEGIVGKKGKNLSKDLLKKQLEKSGKVNDLKAKLAEMKKIDSELRQIGSPKKKSTIARREGAKPTALSPDAPCYVKYRHLAEKGVMDKMKLPASYELLFQQFETGERQVATLYNRGESCVFNKICSAVRQVLSKDFGIKQLEQIMAVAPESYQIQWKKGLYDAKRGSSRIKTSEYQLVLQPIIENDENDDDSAIRFALSHLTKRSRSFRQTLLGVVKDLHEKFLISIGMDISKIKNLKRWHPQFKLDECEPIKPAKIPEKPGAEESAMTATDLLKKMSSSLPDKAKAKLAERTAELEKAELEKIKEKAKEETPKGNKPKIPPHILAKIRAKQAAKAEQLAERVEEKQVECDVLEMAPKAGSILRSYFVTEKKSCYPFDSACKKVVRSWKVPVSIKQVDEMLTKVAELVPAIYTIKTVVGVKYIKILDKNIDPAVIESTCRERIQAIKK